MPVLFAVLLSLFAAAPSTACPSAPASRLGVGMAVVVAPQVGTLIVRSLPARDTGIIARVYANTPMTIVGGRSCNGVYGWWRVELANGQRGWVAEGDWDLYYLIRAGERRTPSPLAWSCMAMHDTRRCPLP